MGIYDSIVLHDSVDTPEFPFSESHLELKDGRRRMWQTKDLNPSMDTYGILPRIERFDGEKEFADSQDLRLYRRYPPITKWTTENLGTIEDEYPDNIIHDADHWRNVRYTGTISITDVAEDSKGYIVEVEVKNGNVQNIELDSDFQAVDSVVPPNYMKVIDLSDDSPTYNGRDVGKIAKDFYDGERLDVPSPDLGRILTFYQTRMINGQYPDFDNLFDFEHGNPKYEGRTLDEWSESMVENDHQLDDYESEAIRIYRDLQRDRRYLDSNSTGE